VSSVERSGIIAREKGHMAGPALRQTIHPHGGIQREDNGLGSGGWVFVQHRKPILEERPEGR